MKHRGLEGLVLFAAIALSLIPCVYGQMPERISLSHGWQFREAPNDSSVRVPGWHAATVPGDVHLDLLANKLISQPFERDNEAKLQWIGEASWDYRTTMDMDAATLRHEDVELVFEGLDSAATVSVNGHVALQAANSFREWRADIKPFLHVGKNVLLLHFESPYKTASRIAAADPWYGKTPTAAKSYLRKPAYEYGWDWGPTFVTSGIWQTAYIESWNSQRVRDLFVHQRNISKSLARVQIEATIVSSRAEHATLQLLWKIPGKLSASTGRSSLQVELLPGENDIGLPIEIRNPDLWFPNGYGAQTLYDFKLTVATRAQVQDERSEETGLRSILLRRNPDQWGRSFEFVVNGIPVYAKGADVIPFDSFPSRVNEAQVSYMLQSAKDANMNMVRVWGGGYYQSDAFYRIADELGIMVWQDFMFGNDWQPGTYSFRQEMEKEATYQVTRLRNHPSIVLWCGNNETEESLPWPKNKMAQKLDTRSRVRIWQDYLLLFSGTLPDVVARLDPEVPYWPSSPSADYKDMPAGKQSGDSHNWDIFHGRRPFSDYEKHHERFVSEYGFQSFPEWQTVLSYTDEADRKDVFTSVMDAHQKSPVGNSIIHDYMLRDYSEPKDFKSFLYVSQVLQAEGVKIGAEHLRQIRPRNMGSLFWQLNDCWPVASWSSIDYYGRWKALQYYARRFYSPTLVSPHVEHGSMQIYVVSDETAAQDAELRVRIMTFSGTVLREIKKNITIPALSSAIYEDATIASLLPPGRNPATVAVDVDLHVGKNLTSSNLIYLVPTKQIHLPHADVKMQISAVAGGVQIRLSSRLLARDVYLSLDRPEASRSNLGDVDTFSDNYFDLLPDEPRDILLHTAMSVDQARAVLGVIVGRRIRADHAHRRCETTVCTKTMKEPA